MTEQGEAAEALDFYCASGYGQRTHEPFVSVKFGDVFTQVTPAKAREMAMILLTTAESAVQDGFIVEMARGKLGLDERAAGMFLGDFRQWREERRADA